MFTESMVLALVAAVGGVGASSGFWTYFQRQSDKNSASSRLLMGLAYDKIATVGISYINRGYISKDEYEEYLKYLVQPYKEMGGNGVADRIAAEVGSLPIRTIPLVEVVVNKEGKFDAA